ncbi:class I SAM-dependent methyltransferase [Shewanella psychropiezotolerans]|uniref:Class I SAM-dependent methyltransferase n=1 Tax=Shewanella psychropiezotolerans TaxID=2593655 RepID=A0ABX5WY47_9GAMM|nr:MULTISPECIES: class I SAM-dependent methyltransferase [Shewanella]MPY22999.1 class I SAM-dependent methyltransferase [Shewanella sp. YLB-07]QDO82663.1 class I SAM-dependent methyltransferase [Shewanella psychropiezotolerans]
MWDQRYSTLKYAYGTTENDFLRSNIQSIPKGKILSLGEGEGRNAVYLAKAGYSVTAVDSSIVGLNKAKALAKINGVSIEVVHADLTEYDLGENQWDGIISIFCPLPSTIRKSLHTKIQSALKADGAFLVEAYTPEQVLRNTGGGKCVDVFQTKQTLTDELNGLTIQYLAELQRKVIEGSYHTGMSSVVQAIAVKNK